MSASIIGKIDDQGTEALIRSDYFGKLSMNAIGGEEIIRSIRRREGC